MAVLFIFPRLQWLFRRWGYAFLAEEIQRKKDNKQQTMETAADGQQAGEARVSILCTAARTDPKIPRQNYCTFQYSRLLLSSGLLKIAHWPRWAMLTAYWAVVYPKRKRSQTDNSTYLTWKQGSRGVQVFSPGRMNGGFGVLSTNNWNPHPAGTHVLP